MNDGVGAAGAGHGRLAAVYLSLTAMLALRFVAEVVYRLPSPVGDGGFFVTTSVNYCRSDFLGTTAYPIDPTGRARMVWHGFVSPMLFGAASLSCSARSFYALLWALKAATLAAVGVLAQRRRYPLAATLGLALFVLAAQTASGFRPETLAMLLVVLAEIAICADWPITLGVLAATLLCTQPTVAGLYGLTLLLLRPNLTRRWRPIACGALVTLAVLPALYPFPVADLVNGIRLQAVRLIGRSDGSLAGYYVLNPWLPGWGLLLAVAAALVVRRRPAWLLLLPLIWFFGPRVPPVYYNLVPLAVVLLAFALESGSPAAAARLGFAALAVGALGLAFATTRDLLTAYDYGDTFEATRARVAALAASGHRFEAVVPMIALTNPELRLTDPTAATTRSNVGALDSAVDLYAVNGAPRPPCAAQAPDGATVALSIGGRRLFNSNSGWTIYVCDPPIWPKLDQLPGVPSAVQIHPTGAPGAGSVL
jgi:hypothetical protein